MVPPYFFQQSLPRSPQMHTMDEAASKHCIQVLRMFAGQNICLTDGEGRLAEATIVSPDKKHCTVYINKITATPAPHTPGFSIGIAFTKNNTRNEWLLEKLTEMGTEHIYPIISEHSERDRFNRERYEKVLIAALLQSQQTYLPSLHPLRKLETFLQSLDHNHTGQRFIAHCHDGDDSRQSLASLIRKGEGCFMLIGPEGDFSEKEVQQCSRSGFVPVHLGNHRLRTETAGIFACAVYNASQHE